MIDEKNIRDAIEACGKLGHSVRIRDIAYLILTKSISVKPMVYQAVFGVEPTDIEAYESTAAMSFLKSYIDLNFKSDDTLSDKDKMTFEENKNEMQRLIDRIEAAMVDEKMEVKEGYKQIADIRVKLNDKFNISSEKKTQMVIVEQKFNTVCPYTRRECYLQQNETKQ